MIKISIISVAFNDLPGLFKTCASVDHLLKCNVDGLNFEHLVIDGGSQDGTKEFLVSRSMKSVPMKFSFISERDFGIYDAMNKGVLLASGEYVVFLNSGDEISSDFSLLGLHADVLSELVDPRSAGIAYSAVVRYGSSNGRRLIARNVELNNPRLPTVHQSMFYKRNLLLQYGFKINLSICGDYENFSRMLADGLRFKPVDDVFSIFGADGVSARSPVRLFVESSGITWDIPYLSWIHKIKVTVRLSVSLFVHTLWAFAFRRSK